MLEIATWQWARLPDMSCRRMSHVCGRAGRTIVVVGNCETTDRSEIFDLDTQTWSSGPAIPLGSGKKFSSSVQSYQLPDTFYVLGGYDGTDRLDTVFEYDPANRGWIKRPERLPTATNMHAVVPIPAFALAHLLE